MNVKRVLMAAMLPVLVAGPVLASTCLRPEERKAADTWALNSYMAVMALQCKVETRVSNEFRTPNRGELKAAHDVMQGYFRRAHGNAGQTRFDQYYTNISQDHAMDASRAGSFFCRDAETILMQVRALRPGELAKFSTNQNIIQTLEAPDCAAGAAPQQRPRTTRR